MEWNFINDPDNNNKSISVSSKRGKDIIAKYNRQISQLGGHAGPCDLNETTGRCHKGIKKNKNCELKNGNCRIKRRSPRIKKMKLKKIRQEQIKLVISDIPKQKVTKKTECCIYGNKGRVSYTKNVMLAKDFIKNDGSNIIDPTGWWLSEKFDGYRALWNGKYFKSRSGKRFSVPNWFSKIMPPSVPLDGELWLGRNNFEKCGLFRKKRPDKKQKLIEWEEEWKNAKVIFKVFDIPNINLPFEKRMKALKKLIEKRKKCLKTFLKEENMKYIKFPIQFTEQIYVESLDQVKDIFRKVIKAGGEGVMLRAPNSPYVPKRSSYLLKYKETADTECIIIGYQKGTGKYSNMLGSFKCQLMSDPSIIFTLSGMDDCIRKNFNKAESEFYHPIGTIITFKYNGFTKNGVPRHPQYMRKRYDV